MNIFETKDTFLNYKENQETTFSRETYQIVNELSADSFPTLDLHRNHHGHHNLITNSRIDHNLRIRIHNRHHHLKLHLNHHINPDQHNYQLRPSSNLLRSVRPEQPRQQNQRERYICHRLPHWPSPQRIRHHRREQRLRLLCTVPQLEHVCWCCLLSQYGSEGM
jgi:hypothetical protein